MKHLKRKIITLENLNLFKKKINEKINLIPDNLVSVNDLKKCFNFDWKNNYTNFCNKNEINEEQLTETINLPYAKIDVILFKYKDRIFANFGKGQHPDGPSLRSGNYISNNDFRWSTIKYMFPGYENTTCRLMTRNEISQYINIYDFPYCSSKEIWTSEYFVNSDRYGSIAMYYTGGENYKMLDYNKQCGLIGLIE